MAITKDQLMSLGFKPTKLAKGKTTRKYDTLVYYINEEDYLFTGFNNITGRIDFKRIWKSFNGPTGRISYPISKTGSVSLTGLKEYIESLHVLEEVHSELEEIKKKVGKYYPESEDNKG